MFVQQIGSFNEGAASCVHAKLLCCLYALCCCQPVQRRHIGTRAQHLGQSSTSSSSSDSSPAACCPSHSGAHSAGAQPTARMHVPRDQCAALYCCSVSLHLHRLVVVGPAVLGSSSRRSAAPPLVVPPPSSSASTALASISSSSTPPGDGPVLALRFMMHRASASPRPPGTEQAGGGAAQCSRRFLTLICLFIFLVVFLVHVRLDHCTKQPQRTQLHQHQVSHHSAHAAGT